MLLNVYEEILIDSIIGIHLQVQDVRSATKYIWVDLKPSYHFASQEMSPNSTNTLNANLTPFNNVCLILPVLLN